MNKIEIQEIQPSTQVYNELREIVGWHILEPGRAEAALKHSLFCLCAVDTSRNNAVIGMGRVVGDGAAYFYIQDIILSPAYQKQGVGRRLLGSLMDWVNEQAPPNSGAFLGLMTEPSLTHFYGHHGFRVMDSSEPFMKIWR